MARRADKGHDDAVVSRLDSDMLLHPFVHRNLLGRPRVARTLIGQLRVIGIGAIVRIGRRACDERTTREAGDFRQLHRAARRFGHVGNQGERFAQA